MNTIHDLDRNHYNTAETGGSIHKLRHAAQDLKNVHSAMAGHGFARLTGFGPEWYDLTKIKNIVHYTELLKGRSDWKKPFTIHVPA
jgi:hypothetical protein